MHRCEVFHLWRRYKRVSVKRIIPVLLATAACGGKSAPKTVTPVDNGGGTEPAAPPYMALFDKGRSWTFALEQSDSYYDDQDPAADQYGMVRSTSQGHASCTVDSVVDFEGGKASLVVCGGDLAENNMGRDPMGGVWIANAEGLHHAASSFLPENGEPPDMEYATLILERVPVAKEEPGFDDEENPENQTSFLTIKQDGDAWCWESSFAWGDESWDSLCIGPDGFESGSFGWAGGSDHEITFTVENP